MSTCIQGHTYMQHLYTGVCTFVQPMYIYTAHIHNDEIYSQLNRCYSEQKTSLATPELGLLLLKGVKVGSFHLNGNDQMENHDTVLTVCCRLYAETSNQGTRPYICSNLLHPQGPRSRNAPGFLETNFQFSYLTSSPGSVRNVPSPNKCFALESSTTKTSLVWHLTRKPYKQKILQKLIDS